jgi:hypothetical protein
MSDEQGQHRWQFKARFQRHAFKTVPGTLFDFLLHRSWLKAYSLAADFFDRHLRPSPAAQ